MIFHANSLSALKCLEKFEKHYQNGADDLDPKVLEKIKRCGYSVLLVAGDEPVLSDGQLGEIDEKTLLALLDAWRSIRNITGKQRNVLKKSWHVIDTIGESILINLTSRSRSVRRFSQSENKEFFFILLTEAEPYGLPAYELLMLSNLWQLKQGLFPLHAAGLSTKVLCIYLPDLRARGKAPWQRSAAQLVIK